MAVPDYCDPGWLERRYHGDGATQQEIADELGVSQTTVRRTMDEAGIEARPPGRRPRDHGPPLELGDGLDYGVHVIGGKVHIVRGGRRSYCASEMRVVFRGMAELRDHLGGRRLSVCRKCLRGKHATDRAGA